MKRLDLDDLPPKIAALLSGLELLTGQESGASTAPPPPAAEPEPYNNQRAAEIFEQFRSAIEDEF